MKKLFILLLTLSLFGSCRLIDNKRQKGLDSDLSSQENCNELERIQSEGVLRVVVDYNSINYFVYKGQPMGFQYEILKSLSNDLGVDLQIVVNNNHAESFDGLNSGEYDIIAKNLTVTNERRKIVDFSEPLIITRHVIVQRKSSDENKKNENSFVSGIYKLAGKTVHVPKESVFAQRLVALSADLSMPVQLVEDSTLGVEQLISMVAHGKIEFTVCEEIVGLANQRYYPWIDVSVPISGNEKVSWALKKNCFQWKKYVDEWIFAFKETAEYQTLIHKYFQDDRNALMVKSEYHSVTGGKISKYDDLIREVASIYNVDWRLIASIIKKESNFDPAAESWGGAMGLMQLMPNTALAYNVSDITDPKENIRAGIAHILYLDNIFKPLITDGVERLKFVLASYNVGVGHVMDARKLALKYGKNSNVWKDNVDYFLLNKSMSAFYNDPVVKLGYCRGEETYNYVNIVIDLYHHYCNLLPENDNMASKGLLALRVSSR